MPPVFTPPQVKPLQPGELPEVNPSDVTESDEAQSAEQSMVMEPDVGNVDNVNDEATQAPEATVVATQTEEESPMHSGDKGVSYVDVGVNTEGKGNDGAQEQTIPAEEEEVEQETIAEVDREECAVQSEEKEKGLASEKASLKEENVRLATELAETRVRLEKLELEAQARAEAVAAAAAASAAAAAASSAKRGEVFKNAAATPERPPGGAEETAPPAKDEATAGAGVQHVAEAEVEVSPMTGETVSEAEGEDVVKAMRGRERSGHKGKITGTGDGEARGRSVSDVVGGAGGDSAKPTPEKRGPSRVATQKQLVAYRTGLSMLVKLCNQLTAASSVAVGLERGSASRTDPETIPVALSTPEGKLSRATPVESRSGEPSAETSSLTVTGEPSLGAPGAVPSADAANVATVAEPTGSPVAFEDSRPLASVADGDNTTGSVEGEIEGRDTVTSVANRVPDATELEEPSREVARTVTAAAAVETPGVEASSKAVTTEGRLAPGTGGGDTVTAGAGEEGEKITAAPAPQGEAASVATEKPSTAETSSGDQTAGTEAGNGGGSDARSNHIVAARSASKGVDKIKRAAEHVAAHIRRSHVSQVRVCFRGCICLEINSFSVIHRCVY